MKTFSTPPPLSTTAPMVHRQPVWARLAPRLACKGQVREAPIFDGNDCLTDELHGRGQQCPQHSALACGSSRRNRRIRTISLQKCARQPLHPTQFQHTGSGDWLLPTPVNSITMADYYRPAAGKPVESCHGDSEEIVDLYHDYAVSQMSRSMSTACACKGRRNQCLLNVIDTICTGTKASRATWMKWSSTTACSMPRQSPPITNINQPGSISAINSLSQSMPMTRSLTSRWRVAISPTNPTGSRSTPSIPVPASKLWRSS